MIELEYFQPLVRGSKVEDGEGRLEGRRAGRQLAYIGSPLADGRLHCLCDLPVTRMPDSLPGLATICLRETEMEFAAQWAEEERESSGVWTRSDATGGRKGVDGMEALETRSRTEGTWAASPFCVGVTANGDLKRAKGKGVRTLAPSP